MTLNKPNHTLDLLPSGHRFLHLHNRGIKVEYFGVAVKAGSRNDPEGKEGLAHFVEHTIFKGTTRRSSHHIINRMEAVGGELNAYTTKEDTFVYSAFPTGNLARAVELIADLVANSQFPKKEIDKEREVIVEEIDSYLDSPADAVFDDFDELLFKDRRLAHNILGNADTIAGISTEDCREFLTRYYQPDNMVIFYSGPSSPLRVKQQVEKYFCQQYLQPVAVNPPVYNGEMQFDSFNLRRNNDNHQAHNVMGSPLPSLYSSDRFAISLFNNIFGGPGMNSRLNVALRERRGLVYSTDSAATLYSDCGAFTIYFGCSPDRVEQCVELIHKELLNLCQQPLNNRQLAAAKRQYIGQIAVSSASPEQTLLSSARGYLYRNQIFTLQQSSQAIEAITAEDLLRVAQYASPERLSMLTLG